MDCKCNQKPYTVEHVLDLDVDNITTPVDYFIGVRTVENPYTGATIATPVRVPGAKVMPTGNLANVAAIDANNSSLTIPENQVRAGYLDVQPGGNIVRLADASHDPMFIIVQNFNDEKVLIQTTGFLNIEAGHEYIVGRQYYLGTNGEPVTDSTITGKKLFRPISEFTLNVNGEF